MIRKDLNPLLPQVVSIFLKFREKIEREIEIKTVVEGGRRRE